MADVHLIVGIAVMATSLVAGIWGGLAWVLNHPSITFWYLLRLAQAVVVVQVVLGALLLIQDRRTADELHYLYGLAPLVVSLVTEGMRAGGAQRELGDKELDSLDRAEKERVALRVVRYETGIMALGALLIFGLALRAGMTSGHFL